MQRQYVRWLVGMLVAGAAGWLGYLLYVGKSLNDISAATTPIALLFSALASFVATDAWLLQAEEREDAKVASRQSDELLLLRMRFEQISLELEHKYRMLERPPIPGPQGRALMSQIGHDMNSDAAKKLRSEIEDLVNKMAAVLKQNPPLRSRK